MFLMDPIVINSINAQNRRDELVEIETINSGVNIYKWMQRGDDTYEFGTYNTITNKFKCELSIEKDWVSKYPHILFRIFVYRGVLARLYTTDEKILKYMKYLKDSLWNYEDIIEKDTKYRISINQKQIKRLEFYLGSENEMVLKIKKLQEKIELKIDQNINMKVAS